MTSQLTPHRHSPKTGPTWRASRPHLIIAGVAALVGLLIGIVASPSPRHGLAATQGDAQLADSVRSGIDSPRPYTGMGVLEITGDDVRYAGLGATAPAADQPIELGSITKTFTGHLLAIAVQRGEVRLGDPLSRHLPELAGTPAGSVTLEELAQHRSGLPRILSDGGWRTAGWLLFGADPYQGSTTQRVIDGAKDVQLNGRGEFAYSNLGMALLGHALAEAADARDWRSLVRERIFTPLGMTRTTIVESPSELPADRLVGRVANGRAVQPWISSGYAPAGSSTWTTVDDIGRYLTAILDDTIPGADALAPTQSAMNGAGIGLGWMSLTEPDLPPLLFHNGGTGGFSTNVTLDKDAGRAAFVVTDSTASVQDVGFRLIAGDAHAEEFRTSSPPPIAGLVLLAGLAFTALTLWWRPATTQLDGLRRIADVLVLGVLTWQVGPWQWLPAACASVLVAVGLVGAWATRNSWRGRPWLPTRALGITGQLIAACVTGLVAAVLLSAALTA